MYKNGEQQNDPGGRTGQTKQHNFKSNAEGCTTVTPSLPSVAALPIETVSTPENSWIMKRIWSRMWISLDEED
jgi:hypothetical protein